MELFTSLTKQLAAVRQLVGEVPEADAIPELVRRLTDDEVLEVLEVVATAMRSLERVQLASAGVISERSTRALGHSGLAQSLGHRNPTSLVQQITGATRAESAREVRVGESLLEPIIEVGTAHTGPGSVAGDSAGGDAGVDTGNGDGVPAALPWHAPLRTALLDGALSSPQHDAIRQGLGEPPTPQDSDLSLSDLQQATEMAREAWRLAAQELINEAQHRTVEELRQSAQTVRDMLDPQGADQRHQARYEARSFRLWRDAAGTYRGSFSFDDEAGAWVRHLIDAALRPRRGGPRFVDPSEQARAQELVDDPRTNDQLTHDLLIDVLRSGTLADAAEVLGVRQAGVRVVTVVDTDANADADADGTTSTTGRSFLEEGGTVLPPAAIDRQICDSGIVPVSVDRRGNPLNLGREQRLFSTKQRIALSLRDGGCRWPNCDRVASYCEAHHIDEWKADSGRTDVDRGLLLCRYHHMQLHNGGWRITRDRTGPFNLHDKHGNTFEMPPRAARTTAWNLAALSPPASRGWGSPPGSPKSPRSPRSSALPGSPGAPAPPGSPALSGPPSPPSPPSPPGSAGTLKTPKAVSESRPGQTPEVGGSSDIAKICGGIKIIKSANLASST